MSETVKAKVPVREGQPVETPEDGQAVSSATSGAETARVVEPGNAGKRPPFLHTIVGKIVAGFLGVAVLGGIAVGGAQLQPETDQEAVRVEVQAEVSPQTEADQPSETVQPPAEKPEQKRSAFTDMTEEDYPTLLRGAATREQLQKVLSRLPILLSDSGLTDIQYWTLVHYNPFCNEGNLTATEEGFQFPVSAANRALSLVTEDHLLSEETSGFWSGCGFSVSGETYVDPWPANDGAMEFTDVTITRAQYTQQEMYIEYDIVVETNNADGEEETEETFTIHATALLQPTSDGKFIIKRIFPGSYENRDAVPQWQYAYADMLHTKALELREEVVHDVLEENVEVLDVRASFYDMNGDGIPELLYMVDYEDLEYYHSYAAYYVYTYDGNQVKQVGHFENIVCASAGGGRGDVDTSATPGNLLVINFMSATGDAYVDEVSLQNGELVRTNLMEDVLYLDIPESTYGPDLVWSSPLGTIGLAHLVCE